MSPAVSRIRNAVKYVRSSTSRMNTFKRCVQISKVESQESLCLDVCTRWNSTYVMLDTAQKFEKAFAEFALQDPSYMIELAQCGIPDHSDWEYACNFSKFLKHFYTLTNRVSGTQYVTSNTFFVEIAGICYLLNKLGENSDITIGGMAAKMMDKFNKYWGDPEKMNMLIFVAAILDPSTKQSDFFKFSILSTYGETKGERVWAKANEALHSLFNEYKTAFSKEFGSKADSPTPSPIESGGTDHTDSTFNILRSLYNKRMKVSGEAHVKTELDKYIAEDIEDSVDDILSWWKCNSPRFPILSYMARDILAIPISTVASESAFSTGGRFLDDFKSSLNPSTMQSLICAQDWLRHLKRKNVEATLKELTKLDEGLESTTASVDSSDQP